MVTTEEKIEKYVLEGNWSMAIRTAVEEDCSENCQRKILEHLVSKKLISFKGTFEKPDINSLSILSIYLFFRICNVLRRYQKKNSLKSNDGIPDRIFFGRTERGEIIDIVITEEFKAILKYDETIVIF